MIFWHNVGFIRFERCYILKSIGRNHKACYNLPGHSAAGKGPREPLTKKRKVRSEIFWYDSFSVAGRVFEASKDVPFFYLEDVYTTGLVANKKLGYKPLRIEGFYHMKAFDKCVYQQSVMASHGYSLSQLKNMWQQAQKATCSGGIPWSIANEHFSLSNVLLLANGKAQ